MGWILERDRCRERKTDSSNSETDQALRIDFEFVGCEKSTHYFNAACSRISEIGRQERLFA